MNRKKERSGWKITLLVSTYSRNVKMATMASDTMRAVEDLLRKATKTKRGKMQIRRLHVDKLLGSNARVRNIDHTAQDA